MAILKDLIVHGSSRFLNKIYANELEVSAFEAESAIIKKLTAKDATLENATVIGLLDVQGQLHTNTWTNSNIATIDGCFYITPTLSSDSGNIVFSSTSVASLTGTYTAVTSLYIGDSSSGSTVQWTKDSKVLLTGEVQVNGQWLPLGTLLGTLSANATTSSIGLTGLTDNRHNTSSIITDIRNAVNNTSLNYRNLKISLYQRRDGTDSKPLGIYMTAMGANGKTFIDIYGGVNATTTAGSSGGFADPNLRIGNLSGLGAVEGTIPTGWGIYTTNGYFKGVIVSSAGKIGNFTINSALYSNNHSAWNSNVSGIYINNDGISGGAGGKWWLWNDGSAKIGAMTLSAAGVLTVPAANVSGKLTAATIDGTQITANTITAGQIAASAITADELAANAVTSAKIKAGQVKATNIASSAVTADKLDATTINASNKLTVGALTTATQNNILNSNIQIGGINLLKNTDATTIAKTITIASTSSSTYSEGWTASVTRVEGENTYTVSFDAKADDDSTTAICHWYNPNTTQSSLSSDGHSGTGADGYVQVNLTTDWKRYWVTWTQSDTASTNKSLIVGRLSKPSSGTKTIYVRAIKMEVGNKATAWSPAPEEVDVRKYITDIDSNKGITIKPADTSGNDYLQMNSSAINFYRNNVETLKIEDSAIRVGKLGNNLRNVYITDSAVQIRNNTSVLAEYGSSIKLYNPTTTTVAVEISSTGASFTGNVKATSLSTGNKTASTTGKGTYIDGNGNIYAGDGSSNNFTVTSAGAMTAKSGTIGKYTITSTCLYTGTGSTQAGIGGNQAFWAGSTDSNSAPFRVSYSGVLNATGATISGNITATSGTIGGASITEDGVLMIKDANISGKISASHIDVSSITIGSLSGADNYALKDDVPTTVAELTDSGSYLTTSAASSTYATQTNLNNEINARKAVYGTSSTDAGTVTKAVTCSNFALYTGASVTVTFSKTNTSSAPQLNVNSTGAKPIKSYTGANLTEGEYKWVAGASITFTYDGTNWRMQDGGALQAKIDAASSASTASSQAGVATQQATNATNAKTAAESAKTAAESAKTAAQSAKTAAETASSQASSAKDTAVSAKNDAVSAKTDAETAKGQAQTAAGNASQSATNAANSATAAAEVMGGFTILWNYSAFGTSDNGEGYLCAFDPATGTKSDANGWVKWNGVKRTITKQMINPNTVLPYNIPIYVVCRLSSASATTGTNYMVWYNSGWKYAIMPTPTAVGGSWTWADNTDIILGKFVETASEAALTEYEIYNPPYTSKQITTNVVTAQSASASAASAAQTATTYITNIDSNNGIRIQPVNYSTNKDSVQINSTAITMYRNEVDVMSLGDSAFRMGTASGKHTTVDSNGLHIWIGSESTAANEVGLFGSTARIGAPASSRFLLNADSLQAYNSSNVKYFEVSASGLSFGGNAVAKVSDIPTTVAQLTDSGSYLTTTVAANTYATQTAANNAAQTASKYITAIDQNGIKIHAENSPSTNYALINASGMSVYQDVSGTAIEVAKFGSSGARIGQENIENMTISSDGTKLINTNGITVFDAYSNSTSEEIKISMSVGIGQGVGKYLKPRPKTGKGITVLAYYTISGSSSVYKVSIPFTAGTTEEKSHSTYIKVKYSAYSDSDYVKVSPISAASYGIISISYIVDSVAPSFSMGTRNTEDGIGAFSTILGRWCSASGINSLATNLGTIANGTSQTAIGKYNTKDNNNTYAFIVGKGSSESNRSNAFTIDWSGNLIASGGATLNGNTSITGTLNATGAITQNGTAVSLDGHTHSSTIVYEDVTVSISYTAGNIGTRGTQVNCGTTAKTGYTYIGECVLSHTNTTAFSVNLIRNDSTGNVHLMVYRANGNAVTNAQVTIRKIWIKNEFVSTV